MAISGSLELDQALSQISEIHGHLNRSEVYRGYRPAPVAFSGLVAIFAAALQGRMLEGRPSAAFALFWVAVAALSAMVCGAAIVRAYVHEDELSRRHTRQVVGQFVPCVAAGLLVTAAVLRVGDGAVPALPGLWAVLFGLGVFASRPYLPRAIGWVALFYFGAGATLLLSLGGQPLGWTMGAVFGFGQTASAWVLHRNLERSAADA